MKVILHHPRREVQVDGRRRVADLLGHLNLNPEAVLVIRGDQLLTKDMEVAEEDVVEIRPVVSGGTWNGAPAGREGARGIAAAPRPAPRRTAA